jgi:hypothetical protein
MTNKKLQTVVDHVIRQYLVDGVVTLRPIKKGRLWRLQTCLKEPHGQLSGDFMFALNMLAGMVVEQVVATQRAMGKEFDFKAVVDVASPIVLSMVLMLRLDRNPTCVQECTET